MNITCNRTYILSQIKNQPTDYKHEIMLFAIWYTIMKTWAFYKGPLTVLSKYWENDFC